MEKKAQMKLCVFHTCLTSYSCLKPYPSAVFIWLMCWRRSATLTAGWSWPVWYGELFLRQWRWGEPPSKLLDSLTELRCSSGNTNRYSSRHPADTEDSAAHALFFFINVEKSRGQLKGKSQHFCRDVSAAEYSNRQEPFRRFLCPKHLTFWQDRLDICLQTWLKVRKQEAALSLDTFSKVLMWSLLPYFEHCSRGHPWRSGPSSHLAGECSALSCCNPESSASDSSPACRTWLPCLWPPSSYCREAGREVGG